MQWTKQVTGIKLKCSEQNKRLAWKLKCSEAVNKTSDWYKNWVFLKTLNFATKTKIKWKSLEKKTGNFDTLFHKAYWGHAQVSVKRTKSSEQWERHKWLCLKAPAGCPGDTDGCNLSVICVVNYSCIDCTSGVDNPKVVSTREDRHEQKEVSLNKHSYYWMLQTETKLIIGRSTTLGCAEDDQTK